MSEMQELMLVLFLSDPKVPNVQVTQMVLMCESAPDPLVLDLQGESQEDGLCGRNALLSYMYVSSKTRRSKMLTWQ